MKKLFGILLVLCLLATLLVPAASADSYTYSIRVFAGAQGEISRTGNVSVDTDNNGIPDYYAPYVFDPNSPGTVVISDIPYNSRIDLTPVEGAVTVSNESKYYVKGVRESGKDNNTVGMLSFRVTEDLDYVIAYGILGSSVAYTVNFEDEEGNQLLESLTFYGNVGDKPVASYQYIEGYQPQAYNLTKTLSANAAENVFTFIYTPIQQPTAGDGTGGPDEGGTGAGDTGTGDTGTGPDAGTTPGGDDAGTGPDAGTVPGGDDDAGNVPGGDNTPGNDDQNLPDDQSPTTNVPDESRDLDDEQGPAANFDGGDAIDGPVIEKNATSSVGFKAAVGTSAVALLGCSIWALWFFAKRKKKDED